jgi:hypothetical protein
MPPVLYCFSYFLDRVSCFLLRLGLNCNPPNHHIPSSWDYRHEPQYPVCIDTS